MTTLETNQSFDLGILSYFDANIIENQSSESANKYLIDLANQNFKKFYSQFMKIKQTRENKRDELDESHQIYDFNKSSYEIDLPEFTTIFPRQKPLPKEQILSRWQKFAKDKGIQKKKRGRMVYDEITQDWVPRYGPNSVKHIADKANWVIEEKKGDDPNMDPFQKKSLEKQLKRQRQNLDTQNNEKVRQGIDLGKHRAIKKEKNVKNKEFKFRKNEKTESKKKNLKQTLEVAQQSSASMGRFDKKVNKNEPDIKVKKRKIIPNFKNHASETSRNMDILSRLSNSTGSKNLKQ